MKKSILVGTLSLFAMLISTHSAQAYAFGGFKWPTTSPVSYHINYSNGEGLNTTMMKNDIEAAANAWRIQAGIPLTLNDVGSTNSKALAYDGTNNIYFLYDTAGLCPQYIACTYYWYMNGQIVDSDMEYNEVYYPVTSDMACTGGNYPEYFLDIMTHEFGHFIGMDHSAVTTATMYYSGGPCDTDLRSLDPDDIAGAQALYGTGTTPPPPPPGPTPPPPPPPTHSHINLAPASLSFSANSGTAPAAQSVAVSNSGNATMNWTASDNQTWCHVSPASGSLGIGANTSISVSVDAQQFGGTLSCSVAVSDPAADNNPQYISVGYTVIGVVDTVAPIVNITAPANGARVNGKTNIAASASDASGIAKVEFYIDNKLVATDISSPYTYSWNVNKPVPAGTHTITAKAYDKASPANTATSSISVVK